MTRNVSVLLALVWSLAFVGLGQEGEGFAFRGEMPAVVPDGTVVDAMIRD